MNPILAEIRGVQACRNGTSPDAIVTEQIQRTVADLRLKTNQFVQEIAQREIQVSAALSTVTTPFSASSPEEEQIQHLTTILESLTKIYGELIASARKERDKKPTSYHRDVEASLSQLERELHQGASPVKRKSFSPEGSGLDRVLERVSYAAAGTKPPVTLKA